VSTVHNTQLEDANLNDAELLEEIGLTGELMVLAAETSGPLSQVAVDAVLGVR
jgi:hypothetical protein